MGAQLFETTPGEMVVYFQLCSSIQQGQKDINVLWKEREEVSLLLPSDTGWMDGGCRHTQWESYIPAARPTSQLKQTTCYSGAYSSYVVKDSAGDTTAHVEAVP